LFRVRDRWGIPKALGLLGCVDAGRTACSRAGRAVNSRQCHRRGSRLTWLRLATSKSARFEAASPTYLCERFCTSSCRRCVRRLLTRTSRSLLAPFGAKLGFLPGASHAFASDCLDECIEMIAAIVICDLIAWLDVLDRTNFDDVFYEINLGIRPA
jgi:hypothetical protein